jgi:hypothetical protein
MPLYNKESTIFRSLCSIVNQNDLPDEVIIVNDGSTDRGVEKLQQFEQLNIKLITQDNRGVSAARNRGIAEAGCDYVAFLDADDEWLPDYLSTIKSLIHHYPEAIGYGTSYLLKYDDGRTKNIRLDRIRFLDKAGILDNYFEVSNHSDPPIWTSAVCIKKKSLLEINGFPVGVKAGEDLLTWARLALEGDFAYSVTPLASYSQRTFDNPPPLPASIDAVGKELLKMLKHPNAKDEGELRKYIARWHKMRALLFLINGAEMQALKEISMSLRLDCFNLKAGVLLLLLPIPSRSRHQLLLNLKKLTLHKK